MCDYASSVVSSSKKSDKPWNPLCIYLNKECPCLFCQEKYQKNKAAVKIRYIFRKKIDNSSNKFNLISISDKDMDYHHHNWMKSIYNKINDNKIIYNYRI